MGIVHRRFYTRPGHVEAGTVFLESNLAIFINSPKYYLCTVTQINSLTESRRKDTLYTERDDKYLPKDFLTSILAKLFIIRKSEK